MTITTAYPTSNMSFTHEKEMTLKDITSALLSGLIMLAAAAPSTAMTLTLGKTIPSVNLEQSGELIISGDHLSYMPWSSEQLKGKVHLMQIMAGRSNAKAVNAPMIEAIKAAHLDPARYQTVTLVNLNDTIWGTRSIVRSKVESNKKDFPNAGFVLDDDGQAFKLWRLEQKSSAIVLVDASGKVLFAKEGALTPEDINRVITEIKANL
jgi:YtfJ family uncharacterized protein